MIIARTASRMTAVADAARDSGRTVAFVPTLGCLHGGHGELIKRARSSDAFVIVSVFVNPLQFRRDAYERYPRDPAKDMAYLTSLNVDAVFAPTVETMWPALASIDLAFEAQDRTSEGRRDDAFVRHAPLAHSSFQWLLVPGRLTERIDGWRHPWHFDGVATVVARLFEIVRPNLACFGEKDVQQLAIIRALADWMDAGVIVRPVPIFRDADGMPSSSRNTQLTPEQRTRAARPPALLKTAAERLDSGRENVEAVAEWLTAAMNALEGVNVEFCDILRTDNLTKALDSDVPLALYVSYWVDDVRLTDTRHARRGEAMDCRLSIADC